MELVLHEGRFVVPDAITLEQLEECKREVCTHLPRGTKYEDFYPSLVLSYASGRRPGDCEGSGPGVVYAKGMSDFLHERGLQCFSGLQVPPGVDWETFMLRLTGENGKREKPKVLIVVLTAALYKSRPCLKEISTAIENKIALLPVRFEDKLPAKEDQWTNLDDQEWEMMKFRVQSKLNKLNNIPNPGTVLNRANALKDIMAQIDQYLPTPVDAPTPPTAAPAPPPPKSSGEPSDGTRFPLGSRVYVNRGHGEEVSGYVTTYDAAKDSYTVELGERGSGGAQEMCSDKDLRIADSPILDNRISRFINSARDKVGSLFWVNPLREGVPENAAASEQLPQGWGSVTDPTSGKTYYYKTATRETQWEFPTSAAGEKAASAAKPSLTGHNWNAAAEGTPQPLASPTKPPPQPPPLRFTLKERVECRDRGQSWQVGTVMSVEPLMVQPDGAAWTAGYRWDEVRVLSPEAVSKPTPQPPVAPLAMERESLTGKSPASEPTPAEMQSYCFGLCSESEEAYAKRMEKERAVAAARAEKALKDALDSGLTLKQLRAKGYIEGLKAVGITCAEAKTAGYTVEDVKRAGYTAREAKAAGYEIKSGYMCAEVKAAGLTSAEAKRAGYTLEEVQQAGYTAREAKTAGFEIRACYTCAEVKAAGLTCAEAKSAGYTLEEVKRANYVEGLKEAGFQLEAVMEAGYVLSEILRGGFTKADAANAGYAAAQLQIALKVAMAAGYACKDARAAGMLSTCKDAREAGFTCKDAKEAGFTCKDARAAGFTCKDAKEAGFTCKDAKAAGFTALKEAGFTCKDATEAGFTCKNAKEAGFTCKDAKEAGFTCKNAKEAGFTCRDAKAAGFTCKDAKEAGFTCKDAKAAWFTCKDAKEAGFDCWDARRAGFDCWDARRAGFTCEEARRAGFTCKDARAAGFTCKDAREAGFTCKDAKDAGMLWTCKDAKEAGFTCWDAKEAGFDCWDARRAGFTCKDAREAGMLSTCKEAREAGFTCKDAKEAGLLSTCKDAREAGFTCKDAKDADLLSTCKDARAAGFKAGRECYEAGFTYEEGRAAGFPSLPLRYQSTDGQYYYLEPRHWRCCKSPSKNSNPG